LQQEYKIFPENKPHLETGPKFHLLQINQVIGFVPKNITLKGNSNAGTQNCVSVSVVDTNAT